MFAPARVALLALLTACSVGAVEGPPPVDAAPSAGETAFNAMIKPLITECVSCHMGTQPILTSYSTIIAKYKTPPGAGNIFVTKGDATAGMHYGLPYLSQAEKDTVAAWINTNP